VQNATVKVAPGTCSNQRPCPFCYQEEFEPFQIIVNGGSSGVTGVNAVASNLTSGGNTISSSEIMLYYEGLYNAVNASNAEGATGYWPDPLVPKVDAYYAESRNAFPFDVPMSVDLGGLCSAATVWNVHWHGNCYRDRHFQTAVRLPDCRNLPSSTASVVRRSILDGTADVPRRWEL
jgi:hypothetical protein